MRDVFIGSLCAIAVFLMSYRGYAILACIALIAVVAFLSGDSPIKRIDPVFWLEATTIVAFGVSCLTKGEAILKDE